MCTEVNTSKDIIDNNNYPKYCDYHKFLLVEELALEPDYRELHYGKCVVIGRVLLQDSQIRLENVRLNNLPSEYTLPVGALSLRLLCLNYIGDALQNGHYYIIHGEVVLLNTKVPQANHIPITARCVHEQIQNLSGEKQREGHLIRLQEDYQPAVKVWYANQIDRADELIEHNLEIRALSARSN